MPRRLYVILSVIAVVLPIVGMSQFVVFGTNNYVEYQVGTLPIVISVPHGGDLEPASIPDRTCNNPTTVRDANTIDVGRAMSDSIFSRTGCYPHVIYCHLRRVKLDANRVLGDGACGNTKAEVAWTEYHHLIDSAQQLAAAQYADDVFYFDIHGHGHPKARIELGYLLEGDDLRLSDSLLSGPSYLNESSIQGLVMDNRQSLNHVELLRGSLAFGTLLADGGYPSVPSQQDPEPELNDLYFSGGYSTQVHTTATGGVVANGVQLELNRPGLRDIDLNRRKFAGVFSDVVLQYIGLHTSVSVGGCSTVVGTHEHSLLKPSNGLKIVPSLLSTFQKEIRFPDLTIEELYAVEVISLDGRVVQQGLINDASFQLKEGLPSGSYFLRVRSEESGWVRTGRVVK